MRVDNTSLLVDCGTVVGVCVAALLFKHVLRGVSAEQYILSETDVTDDGLVVVIVGGVCVDLTEQLSMEMDSSVMLLILFILSLLLLPKFFSL